MFDNLRGELKGLVSCLPLAVVSVWLVFLMTGPGRVRSGGLYQSPTSPLPISPIPSPVTEEAVGPSIISPTPSLVEEAVGPSTFAPLIAVPTQPNYLPWLLGFLAIIGVVGGVMLYRRRRGDEG